jgi:hypothetical protein
MGGNLNSSYCTVPEWHRMHAIISLGATDKLYEGRRPSAGDCSIVLLMVLLARNNSQIALLSPGFVVICFGVAPFDNFVDFWLSNQIQTTATISVKYCTSESLCSERNRVMLRVGRSWISIEISTTVRKLMIHQFNVAEVRFFLIFRIRKHNNRL